MLKHPATAKGPKHTRFGPFELSCRSRSKHVQQDFQQGKPHKQQKKHREDRPNDRSPNPPPVPRQHRRHRQHLGPVIVVPVVRRILPPISIRRTRRRRRRSIPLSTHTVIHRTIRPLPATLPLRRPRRRRRHISLLPIRRRHISRRRSIPIRRWRIPLRPSVIPLPRRRRRQNLRLSRRRLRCRRYALPRRSLCSIQRPFSLIHSIAHELLQIEILNQLLVPHAGRLAAAMRCRSRRTGSRRIANCRSGPAKKAVETITQGVAVLS
jgi:hypothetical protein